MSKDFFLYLEEIIACPTSYLEKWKKDMKREVVGYVCSYVPEELIWSRGDLPFRIFGRAGDTPEADSVIQSYCCRCGRGILEVLLKREVPVDRVIFSNTCDTMQRISDLYIACSFQSNSREIMSPCRLDGEIPLSYFAGILREMGEGIEEEIKRNISLYNEIRVFVRQINIDRINGKLNISNRQMHLLCLGGMLLPPTEFLSILQQIPYKENANYGEKGVIISGSLYLNLDFFQFFDDLGVTLLYSDMCSGMRPYEREVKFSGDIFLDIARSYSHRPLCAAKYYAPYHRIEYLKRLCRDFSPHGLILLIPKFCDPHCFDLPDIEETLEDRVPILFLEVEDPWKFSSQERTRIEAFLESI